MSIFKVENFGHDRNKVATLHQLRSAEPDFGNSGTLAVIRGFQVEMR